MLKKAFFRRSQCLQLLRKSSSVTANLAEESSQKRKQKKPFIKNIIAGNFDKEFLVYPELTSEKLKIVENKYLAVPKTLGSVKDAINSLVAVSTNDNDQVDFSNKFSELTRLSEAIPSLQLGLLIEIHKICVDKMIKKYCSESQKQKYLPLLLKGEKSIAFALGEDNSGSDPSSIETLAIRDRESKAWSINGVKTWVTNAQNADFFLVFSKIKLHDKSRGSNELSVFLIDKQAKGLSIEKIPSYGFEELGLGKLILNNVTLTDDELVGSMNNGYNVAVELLSSFKYSYASCFSSHLKLLLNETITFLNPRKQSMIDLKDCESIRKKISEVFLTIYTLDSMLYLTAGYMDNFDIDTDLESALIHLYCMQDGIEAVNKCLEMLGSRAYDKTLPHYKLSKHLKGLSNAMFSKDICKLYISLTGIQHAIQIVKDDISKLRNSFNYPSFYVKKIINNRRHYSDNPKLNLKLYMNLHPSLKNPCNQLEYCVLRLQYCVERLLVRHGSEIGKRQLDLERISDLLLDIYSMTAILGRASRSYCTGVKFSDDEVLIAKTYCQDAFARSKFLVNRILDDDLIANDLFHLKLSEHLFHHGGYFIEHPLTQNIG